MSMETDENPCRLILADANILIDLCQVGALDVIGALSRRGIAEILIPRTVYDEVSSLVPETRIAELGITILPVTKEQTIRVLAYQDRRLSAPDRALLLMAEAEGYGVWTNDRRLRENCKVRGVDVWWEFQLLKRLVAVGALGMEALLDIARRVENVNPFMKGISQRLLGES